MSKVPDWVRSNIADCAPGGERGTAGVGDLLAALAFFEGRRAQIFGMQYNLHALEDRVALRESCIAALRRWYDELQSTHPDGQVELYEAAARMQLPLELSEPPIVRQKRELVAQRDAMLESLGRPSDALRAWPGLREAVDQLRTIDESVLSSVLESRLPEWTDPGHFEWLADSWVAIASAEVDAEFLPLAAFGGDFLGLLLDAELMAHGEKAPLLYFFHEEDPPFTFVFESCEVATSISRAADAQPTTVSPGSPSAALEQILRARASTLVRERLHSVETYERRGQSFAAIHRQAMQIYEEFDARIRKLGYGA